MPNWVDNNLTIYGTKEQIEKVKGQVSQTTTSRWGNKKESEKPIFSFFNIIPPPEDKIDEYFGVHGYSEGEKKGDTEYNWYNFNNREWGTKWDACESSIEEESENCVTYFFQTAWSPPTPVIQKLSEQNPELDITLRFVEEQGWGGENSYKDGIETEEDSWDVPSSHAENEKVRGDCYACMEYESSEDMKDLYKDCPDYKDYGKPIELYEVPEIQIVGA